MNKKGIIASAIAGLILTGGIAGASACAFKGIKDRDKTINDQKDTIEVITKRNEVFGKQIDQLKQDIDSKNSELVEKNALIESKNAEIVQKDKTITENQKTIESKDLEIANKQATIDEQTANINTLTEQKTQLLSAVTEIDNKINLTTDSVEIDTLEAKKTSILNKLKELDDQILSLTASKTQLENNIKTLQTDKANLQNQVDILTSEKTTLEQQVEVLTGDKASLTEQLTKLKKQLDASTDYNATVKYGLFRDAQLFFRVYDDTGSYFNYLNIVYSNKTDNSNGGEFSTSFVPDEFEFLTGERFKSFLNGKISYSHANNISVDVDVKSESIGNVTLTQSSTTLFTSVIDPLNPVSRIADCDFNNMKMLASDGTTPFDISTIDNSHSYKVDVKDVSCDFDSDNMTIHNIMFYFVVTDLGVTGTSGLYKTGTKTMQKSWSQLLANGDIEVHGGELRVARKDLSGDLIVGNVDGITSLHCAFFGCSNLTSVDLSNLNIAKVSDMNELFSGCGSLETVDISNFDFSAGDHQCVDMFLGVPAKCKILVKDKVAKEFITTGFPDLVNVCVKEA